MTKLPGGVLRTVAAIALLAFSPAFPSRAGWAGDPGPGFPAPASDRLARALEAHAVNGGVDYSSLAKDRADLDSYLAAIATASLETAPGEEALAFWINSYNAVVMLLVLENYPETGSVMDVAGFFKRLTTAVAGEMLTLDEIEARALAFADPRVHFALVCAANSCPPLRSEPYSAGQLDLQLDEQTRLFLADTEKGARFDGDTLWLSSLFKWYGGDFTGGSKVAAFLARGKLTRWVERYLPSETSAIVAAGSPQVKYLDYDWSLNDRRR